MIFKVFVLLFSAVTSYSDDLNCIESAVDIPMNQNVGINYLRVHPSGRYLLYTDTFEYNKCSILEIKKTAQTYSLNRILTPLMEESFPVEPSWDLISSPYHDDGTMKYYSFKDLISKPVDQIKEVYSSTFNEFYHSIGGSKDKFSMVRWNFLGSRDYEIKREKKQISLIEGNTYLTCHNLLEIPPELSEFKDFLNDGMVRIKALMNTSLFRNNSVIAESQINKKYKALEEAGEVVNRGNFYDEVDELEQKLDKETLERMVKNGTLTQSDYDNWLKIAQLFNEFEANKTKKEQKDDVGFFDSLIDYILIKPILSKDGKYISGAFQGETRVYKVNEDKSCTEIASLGAEVAKASFAYPETFKNPVITFYAESTEVDDTMNVYVFDPITKVTHLINNTEADDNVGFPGFTQDGRLIYINDDKIKIVSLNRNKNGTLKNECPSKVN